MDNIKQYEKLNKKADCVTYQLSNEERKVMNKVLRIDPKLRDLLPPLSQEESKLLGENIIKDGCRDPLVIWTDKSTGITYIVDDHNRYGFCERYNVKFETIELAFETKEEVIDWMIDTQLGRRNITDVQKAYLRGLQYEREKIKDSFKGNQYTSGGVQNARNQPTSIRLAEQHKVDESTIRRDGDFAKAVDKIANNIGIEAKNKILNKDVLISKEDVKVLADMNAETQKKLLIENEKKKIKISKPEIEQNKVETPKEEGKIVDQKPLNKPKTKECLKCGLEKSLDEFYIGHGKCKDCEQEEYEKRSKKSNQAQEKDTLDETIKDVKTSRNVEDCLVIESEIECVEMSCNELCEQIKSRFFTMLNTIEKMDNEQIELAISVLDEHIDKISNIKNMFKERIIK